MSSFACLVFETLTESEKYNSGLLALGFFIGLLVGLIVAFILFWICIFRRKFRKHDYHYPGFFEYFYCKSAVEKCTKKSESMTSLRDHDAEENKGYSSSSSSSSSSSDDSIKKKKKRLKKLESKVKDLSEPKDLSPWMILSWRLSTNEPDVPGEAKLPLIDAITQTTEHEGEKELIRQDFLATEKLEESLWQNRVLGLAGICKTYLNKLLKQDAIDEKQREKLSQDQYERLKSFKDGLDKEFNRRHEEIFSPKTPAQKRDEEYAALSIWYSNQLNEGLAREMDNFQADLRRTEKVKAADLDELMSRLKGDVAKLEGKLGEQRIKQCAALEDALARRRQLLAEQKVADDEIVYGMEGRLSSRQKQLSRLVEDKKLSDRDKMNLLNNYRRNLLRQKEAYEKSKLIQNADLQARLRDLRNRQTQELDKQNLAAKAAVLQRCEASTNTDEFIRQFDEQLSRELETSGQRLAELDQKDCDQLSLMRRDMQRDKEVEEGKAEDELGDGLRAEGRLDESDIGRLLDLHHGQMNEFSKHKNNERRQHLLRLEEKLAKRQAEFAQTMEARESELLAVKKQQQVVLKKAMTFEIDMDESAKQKILQEHERNMSAMNNQLQLSRLKQEKGLEQRIAERKARIGVLKKQHRDVKLGLEEQRQKDGERMDKDFQKKIDKEREEMIQESRDGRAQLRDRLAKETEEALKIQEAKMHQVIGKLQVGQLRRKGIIDKQERLIEELEAQVEKRLSQDGDSSLSSRGLDQILQSHFNQVDHLADQLETSKRRQEKLLSEKLEQKKLLKQHAVEEDVAKEEDLVKGALQRTGQGRVATMVLENSLDLKYKKSMEELEEEINLEFKKQQDDLDKEMEAELQQALQEQRKKLLSQLANLTDISSKEMKSLVDKAGQQSGTAPKLTKRMSQDILSSSQQFRAEDRESYGGFQRPASSRKGPSRRRDPDGRSTDSDNDRY